MSSVIWLTRRLGRRASLSSLTGSPPTLLTTSCRRRRRGRCSEWSRYCSLRWGCTRSRGETWCRTGETRRPRTRLADSVRVQYHTEPMSNDTKKVIYSMMGVGRVHPPKRQVLRDISLGFFYGAKIGVLGLNGAGKSTLLRIIAGIDQEY